MDAIVRLRAVIAIFFVAALSGCGGSGGSTLPGAAPIAAPVNPTNSTARSASATIQIPAQGGTYALPSVGGFATQVGFPAASTGAGTTLSVTTSLDAPAGAVTLQSQLRRETTSTTDVLFYLIFTPSITISFPSLPTVSITLPSTTPTGGRNFYASISIPPETGSELSFLNDGPASVTNQTVTFAADPHPLTLQAGKQYIFAFYDTRANGPSGPSIHVADGLSNAIYTFPLAANGNIAPTSVLQGPLTLLSDPIAIAEDNSGRIFVVNGQAAIGGPGLLVYSAGAKGNAAPAFVILNSGGHDSSGPFTHLFNTVAVAVTPSGTTLYTEEGFGEGLGYPIGAVTWARAANGSYTYASGPSEPDYGSNYLGIALDPAGNIFQETNFAPIGVNGAGNTIFGAALVTKNGMIDGPLTTLTSLDPIAVSPTGSEVCAVDVAKIPCFSTGSVGNVAPTRLITNATLQAATGFADNPPFGITYDPAGELLVSVPYTAGQHGAVLVFAANANGNVSAVRTITGQSTELGRPTAVVVGP